MVDHKLNMSADKVALSDMCYFTQRAANVTSSERARYDARKDDEYIAYLAERQDAIVDKFYETAGSGRTTAAQRGIVNQSLNAYSGALLSGRTDFVRNGGYWKKDQSGRWEFKCPATAAAGAKRNLATIGGIWRSIQQLKGKWDNNCQARQIADNGRDQAERRKASQKTKGFLKGLLRGTILGGTLLATYWGVTKLIDKFGHSDGELDRDVLNKTKIEHRMTQKESLEYQADYGATQQGWVVDGQQYIQQHQPQPETQTIIEEESHETVEEFTQPQTRTTRIIKTTPPPQPQTSEYITIDEIRTQADQHAVEYQTVMQPQKVVQVQTPSVTTTVVDDTPVKLAVVEGLKEIGVAGLNAWGNAEVARFMSRKGPDVLSITDSHDIVGSFNDNSSRSLVTGNGNDYSDQSVRIGGGHGHGMGHGHKPGMGPSVKPGMGPGHKPGMGPSVKPGMGPGHKPGMGPSVKPGMGPGHKPGMGHGAKPGMGPGAKPGMGHGAKPSMGPGAKPGMGSVRKPSMGPGAKPSMGSVRKPSMGSGMKKTLSSQPQVRTPMMKTMQTRSVQGGKFSKGNVQKSGHKATYRTLGRSGGHRP